MVDVSVSGGGVLGVGLGLGEVGDGLAVVVELDVEVALGEVVLDAVEVGDSVPVAVVEVVPVPVAVEVPVEVLVALPVPEVVDDPEPGGVAEVLVEVAVEVMLVDVLEPAGSGAAEQPARPMAARPSELAHTRFTAVRRAVMDGSPLGGRSGAGCGTYCG